MRINETKIKFCVSCDDHAWNDFKECIWCYKVNKEITSSD